MDEECPGCGKQMEECIGPKDLTVAGDTIDEYYIGRLHILICPHCWYEETRSVYFT